MEGWKRSNVGHVYQMRYHVGPHGRWYGVVDDRTEGVTTVFGSASLRLHIAVPLEARQECALRTRAACTARYHVLSPHCVPVLSFPISED